MARLGDHRATISDERMEELKNLLNEAEFFAFSDLYYEDVTDLPTTFLFYNNGQKQLRITDYYGAPQSLKDLEKKIEVYIESLDWINN